MDLLVNKLVTYCISNHYVDSSKEEWLRYGFEMRLSTLLVLIPFIVLACALTNLPCALSFFISFYYLKRFTSGYHAKSPYTCLLASLLIELFFLCVFCPLLDYHRVIFVNALCVFGIFIMAPYNHPNIHLTTEEQAALQHASRRSVILLSFVSISCLKFDFSNIAMGITTGMAMAVSLLVLAYILDWRNIK